MRHPKVIDWERRMRTLFDEIDDWLEDKYGSDYPLHPNRAPRGETSSREMDGLFNIGADFTAGYGSRCGRGYVVSIRMSTLSDVPEDIRRRIRRDVRRLVTKKLPVVFPDRQLQVEQDGDLLKIVGDFSLGAVIGK
jgi:hypothetical protein